MQQERENSNEHTAGPSRSQNDPSNIKFGDVLKTYHNDLLTAYYTRIGFKDNHRFG